MKEKISIFFKNPKKLTFLNAIFIIIAIIGNTWIQIFCNPTPWAIILISICFTNSIFHPLLKKKNKLLPIISLINGISFCLFIYCIIFLEYMNYIGFLLILIGIGIITFIPHFFAIQLLWNGFIKQPSKPAKQFFLFGILISFTFLIASGISYNKALSHIKYFKQSNYQILEKNFMTEKILGMGIIYHTQFCEYDGWRPPKHEPILNIGLWLHGRKNPLDIDLQTRVELYQKFFPNKKLKYNCSCAISYSEYYHNDKLWK